MNRKKEAGKKKCVDTRGTFAPLRPTVQVRIDRDVAKKVVAHSKKNRRSYSKEVTVALAVYYALAETEKPVVSEVIRVSK